MVMGYTRYRPMLLSCFLAVCCWQAGNTKDTSNPTRASYPNNISWPPCEVGQSRQIQPSCGDMRSMNCSVQPAISNYDSLCIRGASSSCNVIMIQIQVCNKTVYAKTVCSYSDVSSFLNHLTAINVSLLHNSTYNLTATAHEYRNYTVTINCTDTSSNNAACDARTSVSSIVVTPTVQPFGSISSTTSYDVTSGVQSFGYISSTISYDVTPGGLTSEAQLISSSSSYDASSNIGTTTVSMTASSAPVNNPDAATNSNATNVRAIATGAILPIIAIAVIVAIVIILVLRKSRQHSKWRPLETEANGLDNVVYNDSSTTIGMNTLAPYVIYEPLKDAEMANYDYIDEDCNPYIIPASHEEELYVQLENQRIKKIPRNKIEATTMLGSGQFGGVQIGIWNGSKGKCEVAIKTLNPTITQPDAKVKFLQEAAIMAQFRHPNVIQLYGIVNDGEPIMLVLELANKKDLRTYLSTLKPDPGQMVHTDTTISLLTYSKQIAAGMKYLSNKSFVHRDLAARNILVTQDCTCKIADFGMSRDLADDTYYVSQGGMVPIKWTAPEAIHFKKYSTASDVWSYGCLLYEIWSMGIKPFEGKGNAEVIQKVDSGYRLPPPPGCPLLVYELMIQCWNPETHSRPKFGDIVQSLHQPKEIVLVIPDEAHLTHPQARVLGAPLEAGENMYIELQKTYMVYV